MRPHLTILNLKNIAKHTFKEGELEELAKSGANPMDLVIEAYKKTLEDSFNSMYGNLDRFEKNSLEYQRGLEYIKADVQNVACIDEYNSYIFIRNLDNAMYVELNKALSAKGLARNEIERLFRKKGVIST